MEHLTESLRCGAKPLAALLGHYDKHRPQIDAAFEWASRNSERSSVAAEVCIEFAGCCDPSGGNSILDLRQSQTESRRWLEQALSAARRLGWTNHEAVIRFHLAGVAVSDARTDEALQHANAALEYFRQVGDERQAGIAHNLIGVCWLIEGDSKRAIDSVSDGLTSFRNLKLDNDVIFTLILLAQACIKADRFDEAIAAADEARQLAHDRRDDRAEIDALKKLANACTRLTQHDRALAYELEAIAIRERANPSQETWPVGFGAFDILRLRATKTGGSFEELKADLVMYHQVGNWVAEGFTLACLGLATLAQSDRTTGLAFLKQSIDLFQSHHYTLGEKTIGRFLENTLADGLEKVV